MGNSVLRLDIPLRKQNSVLYKTTMPLYLFKVIMWRDYHQSPQYTPSRCLPQNRQTKYLLLYAAAGCGSLWKRNTTAEITFGLWWLTEHVQVFGFGVSLFFFATYLVSSACIFIMSELVFFVIPPTSFKLIVVKEASVSVSLVSNCHQEAQFFLHDSFRVRSKKMLVEIVIE